MEKIYEGRQGSNQYQQKRSATNVALHDKGRTTDLVAKDFGISGRQKSAQPIKIREEVAEQ